MWDDRRIVNVMTDRIVVGAEKAPVPAGFRRYDIANADVPEKILWRAKQERLKS